jgi:hypothetical protein
MGRTQTAQWEPVALFPRGKGGRRQKLTVHLHPLHRERKRGLILPILIRIYGAPGKSQCYIFGFEVFQNFFLLRSEIDIFWDITQYRQVKVNRRFELTYFGPAACFMLVTCKTYPSTSKKEPKRQLKFIRLYGVISQRQKSYSGLAHVYLSGDRLTGFCAVSNHTPCISYLRLILEKKVEERCLMKQNYHWETLRL